MRTNLSVPEDASRSLSFYSAAPVGTRVFTSGKTILPFEAAAPSHQSTAVVDSAFQARGRARLDWLEDVYSYVRRGAVDEALDLVFETLGRAFREGRFDDCEAAMSAVDLKRLDTNLIVGFLSVTKRAAEDLSESRPPFVTRIEKLLAATEPERAERLLNGLR